MHPVAPLAGVWIEIMRHQRFHNFRFVAPLAGVWIEINTDSVELVVDPVAPLSGVWIEILISFKVASKVRSLPLRECGLK